VDDLPSSEANDGLEELHADPRTLLIYDDSREDRAGEVARLVAAWR